MSSRLRFSAAALALVLSLIVTGLQAADPEVIDIGGRRELFVDGHLIERMDGAKLRLHRPTPREIAVVHDQPWEGKSSGYKTVFKDDDRYRMYYRGSHVIYTREGFAEPHKEVVCYAESQDGIHWTKPDLGLVEFEGSTKNNIKWGIHLTQVTTTYCGWPLAAPGKACR